jgi:hypothetical protein
MPLHGVTLQPPGRQGASDFHFFSHSLTAPIITPPQNTPQEFFILLAGLKIAVPAQTQFLRHGFLEAIMSLLDIAILVSTSRVAMRGTQSIRPEQALIARGELIPLPGAA